MTRSFNRTQVLNATLNILASLLASAATVVFFVVATRFVVYAFSIPAHQNTPAITATAALGLVFLVGFQDSDLYLDFEPITGGSAYIHAEASKIVAPAYLLV